MNKIRLSIVTILILGLFSSWGFFAHKKINETAVFLLPSDLSPFYKKNIKAITNKAIDPDKRCYTDSLEPRRHYIDLNELNENMDSIPLQWTTAVEKYTERKLLDHGIIPWQISRTYQKLVNAFTAKDATTIIRYSADLGHYIADAHVPLHTTSNYNGQQTDQIGIHAFWETRIPEMFFKEYNLYIGPARYIDNPLKEAWKIVKSSNSLVDSVLSIEKSLAQHYRPAEIKSYIVRNNQLTLTYSDPYTIAYNSALNGMVERRFKAAIHAVASFWYSAWIDAGQPKLTNITPPTEIESIAIPVDSTSKPLGRIEWHY